MTDLTTTTPEPSTYDHLIAAGWEVVPAVTVVAHPCDRTSPRRALEGAENRLIVPALAERRLGLKDYGIADAPHSHGAAAQAVALIREGRGELVMKGSLHTDKLMREGTASATGLRKARRILAHADAARVALGVRVPIVLTSRVVAALVAAKRRKIEVAA